MVFEAYDVPWEGVAVPVNWLLVGHKTPVEKLLIWYFPFRTDQPRVFMSAFLSCGGYREGR